MNPFAQSSLGIKRSEETKRKLSISKKGTTPWLGKKHSIESRKKMSETQQKKFAAGYKRNSTIFIKGVTIYQYCLNNTFIREWSSIKLAGTSLNIPPTNISLCANGKSNSAGGYIWKKNKTDFVIERPKPLHVNSVSISINDVSYPSLAHASRDLRLPLGTIRYRCLSSNFINYQMI